MITAIEKLKRPALKITRRNGKPFVIEVPDQLYTVIVNKRHQEKETENKPEQEIEIGLPVQPKEYLKYPDYDWF